MAAATLVATPDPDGNDEHSTFNASFTSPDANFVWTHTPVVPVVSTSITSGDINWKWDR